MAGRPGEGGDFAEIAAGAWDFERINRHYARHLACRSGDSAERRVLYDESPDGAALPRRRYGVVGGGGARGVAGRGDERSAAAGSDTAVGLSGATGVGISRGAAFTPLQRAMASGRWTESIEMRTVKRRERRAPKEAWRRVEVLRDAGRQLRTFNPDKTGAGRA